jgi:hypothetical protein
MHTTTTLPPWAWPGSPRGIVIRMKTSPEELVEKSGGAAGPQELWEALNAKYHTGEGGESFDVIYKHEVWHDEGYSGGDHFLSLTRRNGEAPKQGEEERILKWAKRESP